MPSMWGYRSQSTVVCEYARTSIDGRKVEKEFVVKHAEQKAAEIENTAPDRMRNPTDPPKLKRTLWNND